MGIRVKYVSASILVSLLFFTIYQTRLEPFNSFSLRFNDLNFFLQTKKASPDIVFIKIDEESVNTFGRWPWDRSVIAKAIDKLDSSSLLILDMVFSEPTSSDDVLAKSIVRQDNSLCGFFLRHSSSAATTQKQLDALSDSSLERLQSQTRGEKIFIEGKEAEINIEPILSSCSMSATFSTMRDEDQVFRKYPLAFSLGGNLFPSIGLQALRMKLNKDISRTTKQHYQLSEHKIFSDEEGFALLNYYPIDTYTSYSFMDLYNGSLDAKLLKEKIVIFGITEVGVGDMKATPAGIMAGPLIHYTFISNVLQDELLYKDKRISYAVLLFFLFLPLIWMLISSIFKRVLIYTSSYMLFFVFSKLAFVYMNLYVDVFYPILALIMSSVVIETMLHRKQEKEGKFVEDAFSSYLSPILLKKLMKDPTSLSLGGQKKELTIFFSDIRSFTTISEKMNDPEKLTSYLNRYFTPMSDIILDHNGMIDKYIGDAVMAFYNAPVDVKDHASQACKASLKMLGRLEELNLEFKKEGLPPIEIGIGLNSAEVVVGNMGSLKRFNYTVIGDGVNLASRVEGINKVYGTHIIITEFTKAAIGDEFLTREIEKVQVKGKAEEVLLYELLRDTDENIELVKKYNIALDLYKDKKFQEALVHFELLSEKDSVSKYFLQRIMDGK